MAPRGRLLVPAVIALLIGSFLAGYFFATSQVVQEQKIVIAVQPTHAPGELEFKAKELEEFLEGRVGVDIEIYIPLSYSAVIEAIRFGNAHAAFMSAWPSYIANKLAGAETVLAEVREVIIGEERKEAPFYFSYWVVLKDSPYKSLAELRGKRVAFPSPVSTSGYLFPMARLVELGLIPKPTTGEADPKAFFGEVLFAGGYGASWQALKRGQVDVAIIAGDVSEELYREVLANTRIIEQQGPIPTHAVVLAKGLKEPLRSKLIDALLELNQPQHRDLMRKFISAFFVGFERTTTEKHAGGLRAALEATGFKFAEGIG